MFESLKSLSADIFPHTTQMDQLKGGIGLLAKMDSLKGWVQSSEVFHKIMCIIVASE